MEFKNLLWEKREAVGIITLNREDVRNALKKTSMGDAAWGT
jgi:enoyl-CoA hydratase/carnithine racemase